MWYRGSVGDRYSTDYTFAAVVKKSGIFNFQLIDSLLDSFGSLMASLVCRVIYSVLSIA